MTIPKLHIHGTWHFYTSPFQLQPLHLLAINEGVLVGQAPHAQGHLQNRLNTGRTAEREILHQLQCLPAQLGQAAHHSDAQGLQKKCMPQSPRCPTFLHRHLHKENMEPPRQPSKTGFSLFASSSSQESSTVASLISIPRAAAAPQHKYEHLP